MEDRGKAGHFRKHGYIHALWIIAILIFVNAWNLLLLPAGQLVSDFISFAASIASLVLAIVAIFYSFVSSRDFNENLGRLTASAERSEDAAGKVLSSTSNLSALAEGLRKEFQNFAPAMSEIYGKVDAVHAILGERPTDPGDDTDTSDLGANVIAPMTTGGLISTYLMIKAHEAKKFVDVVEVFPNDQTWQAYCGAFMHAVETFEPCGMKVSSDQSSFHVIDLGCLSTSALRERIDRNVENNEPIRNLKSQIDRFFAGTRSTSEAGSSEDDPSEN